MMQLTKVMLDHFLVRKGAMGSSLRCLFKAYASISSSVGALLSTMELYGRFRSSIRDNLSASAFSLSSFFNASATFFFRTSSSSSDSLEDEELLLEEEELDSSFFPFFDFFFIFFFFIFFFFFLFFFLLVFSVFDLWSW